MALRAVFKKKRGISRHQSEGPRTASSRFPSRKASRQKSATTAAARKQEQKRRRAHTHTTALNDDSVSVNGNRMKKVMTPRDNVETKEDVSDNMTEQEMEQAAENQAFVGRGQEHFGDLPRRFEFIRYLGHGSYGHVCEGTDLETGKKVAVKKIMKIFDNDIDAKRLLRELRILRLLKGHDNIVELIDIVVPEDLNNFNAITLVFEFVDTDLNKLFASDQYFSILHVQYMLYQMLLGLKYMHSANIAHRDLKPANILVNENCTLKLCDFGLSRGLTENATMPHPEAQDVLDMPSPEEQKHQERIAKKRTKGNVQRAVTKHVVTRWYRAPEVILLQQRRDTLRAIDMWSIGCIMAELLCMIQDIQGNHNERHPIFPGRSSFPLSANDPFAWADRTDQLNVIFDIIGTPSRADIAKLQDDKARSYLTSLPTKPPLNLNTHKFNNQLKPDCIDLLRGLLAFDVETRYTVDQAIRHPFLDKVRDPELEHALPPQGFEFEDVAVTLHQLRALIIDEISEYNPELRDRIRSESTAGNPTATDHV